MFDKRIILLLAASVIAGCSKDIERTLVIRAHTESSGTKTVLLEDLSVAFSADDRLAVFDGAGSRREFSIQTLYDDGSADYMGSISTPASSYTVVSPYMNGCYLADGDLVVTVPEVQTAVAGSFDPAANVSVGCTETFFGGANTLSLKNVCALLKFSVPEGTSYGSALILSAGNSLSGEFSCTVGNAPEASPVTGKTLDHVILKGGISGGNWYYMAVCPSVLEGGFAFYLFDGEGSMEKLEDFSTVKSTARAVTLKRNVILNLGIIGAEPGAAFEGLDGTVKFEW